MLHLLYRTQNSIHPEAIWPPPPTKAMPPVDTSVKQTVSDWIRSGNLDLGDIITNIYDRANKMYGTNEKPEM